MNDQTALARFREPGVPVIRNVNWGGLKTLYLKEVRRFFKVQLQTVWAPAISTLLYLVIFSVALGGAKQTILGHSFTAFVAPGLIVMGMMQAAFANASFSLLVGKIQGTIVDYLMPPLGSAEVLTALVASAMTRALLVGLVVFAAMKLLGVPLAILHPWAVVWYATLGAMMLSLIGVITSIWAEKFDHAAAVTNFVILPLSLLSGTFYVVDRLSPAFQTLSRLNPFHHAIAGFRYGFLGASDSDLATGSLALIAWCAGLAITAYLLLRRGWRLRA